MEFQGELSELFFKAGVPNFWDLMPDDTGWSRCNNNRNKVHNKGDMLESSRNHPHPLVRGKMIFQETSPWCQKGWGPLPYRLDLFIYIPIWPQHTLIPDTLVSDMQDFLGYQSSILLFIQFNTQFLLVYCHPGTRIATANAYE